MLKSAEIRLNPWTQVSFLSGLLVLHWGSTRCGTLYSKYLMIVSLSNVYNEALTWFRSAEIRPSRLPYGSSWIRLVLH